MSARRMACVVVITPGVVTCGFGVSILLPMLLLAICGNWSFGMGVLKNNEPIPMSNAMQAAAPQ
ncbi:hypothetical protein [Phocaeicola oris]|uniref:hypothetical protein n=1 Tax=Phocaeicola oris TaxID=2896850 RepID=UPI00234F6CDD|nr:hypothetical protein [Phocaeicola oris]MCE2616278.1 hypothetical protein [Phocaeicola oris]